MVVAQSSAPENIPQSFLLKIFRELLPVEGADWLTSVDQKAVALD
jgi:hypothetical protein